VTRSLKGTEKVSPKLKYSKMSDYFDDDIDDDLLFEITDQDILDPSNRTSLTHPKPELKKPKQKSILDFQQPLLRMDTVNPHNPISKPSYHEINESTIKKWIYPINYPIRDYQFNICRTAMFKNTLVCLPTGLGKTFIAAVIMYNYYRWFPEGKIVFLAPTKPLVNQQIEACFKITGIPRSDVVELTGTVQASVRKLEYKTKRLLFMTPETFRNDICSGDCPYKQVMEIN
jgi:superfamily II RNA helicase